MNKCKIRRVTLILAGAAVAFACFWRDEPIVVQAEGVPEIERLRAPSIREGDVAVLRDCADRNEILNELFSREDVPEALVPELCRLAGDPSQDAVLLLLEEIRHPEVSSIASRIAASRQFGYLAETARAVLGRAGIEK